MERRMFLQRRIKGACSGLLYGEVGDPVILISNHVNVLIVESKSGQRFSVKDGDVTGEIATALLSPPVVEEIKTRAPAKSKSKASKQQLDTQPQLF